MHLFMKHTYPTSTIRIHVVVRLTRVDLAQEEASLGAALLAVNVPRYWEPTREDLLGVCHWGF